MVLGFNRKFFESFKSTYLATEVLIDEVKASGKVSTYAAKNSYGEFLCNTNSKTAVYLKFVAKLAKRSTTKTNRRYENDYDIAHRLTTTTVGKNAVLHFFSNPQFKDFDLVVPTGNHFHEACIFVRKRDECMKIIYYNPNRSIHTNGVQYNQVTAQLIRMLGKKVESVEAFHSKCGNLKGKCSVLNWEIIFSHVINGNSPFRNNNLPLEDYKHLVTSYSYKKYHSNTSSSGDYVFNHFKIWKILDEKLCELGVEDMDMSEIATQFCVLAYKHF